MSEPPHPVLLPHQRVYARLRRAMGEKEHSVPAAYISLPREEINYPGSSRVRRFIRCIQTKNGDGQKTRPRRSVRRRRMETHNAGEVDLTRRARVAELVAYASP